MRGEVLGFERRRRWSDDEKLSIVREVSVGGATTTQVAQRHEVTRSQIYGWRRELKHKGIFPAEVPVRFVSLAPMPPDPAPADDKTGSDALVEIVLIGGRRLRVPAGIDAAALSRLIRATETA
jgi:transposase